MSSKKEPGVRPLGYGPAGKEKLEGPKVHHDYHGMTASVPAKGKGKAVPGEHWQKHYNPHPAGDNRGIKAFDPRVASDRPCTHNKVNESDH